MMKMKVEQVKLSKLVPDPENAREHDERNITELMRALKKFGQHRAAVVQRSSMKILIGNGMFEAAKRLGWSELAVNFVDDDDSTAIERALSDNRLAELARWNYSILSGIVTKNALDDVPGWSPDELKGLPGIAEKLDGLGSGVDIQSQAKKSDEKSLTISLTADQARAVKSRIKELGKEVFAEHLAAAVENGSI